MTQPFLSPALRWLLCSVCTLIGWQHANAQNVSIILGRPTDTQVTASVLSDQNIDFYLDYGSTSSLGISSAVYAAQADVPLEMDLTGLQPNTAYQYRLYYRSSGSTAYSNTALYHFHTQRAQGSHFVFTVEADEHLYSNYSNTTMYQTTLANQALDQPDFMLSLGDIFGDDHSPATTTNVQEQDMHKVYRQYLGQICHSIPFYVCLGNHDAENDYYINLNGQYTTATNNLPAAPNCIGVWNTLWRKYYYPNPAPNSFYSGNTTAEGFGIDLPENYFAWTWGDALFVVLDVYRTEIAPGTTPVDGSKPLNWEWTLGYTQYQWMRSVLENSSATHKFVFAHHTRGQGRGGISTATGCEWGGMDGNQYKFDQYRPGWGKPIHQVFRDTGVTIFFQGHDHLFAKETLDNIVYQAVPMPSDITYTKGYTANASAYTDVVLDGSGHVRVTVDAQCVKVDYVKGYVTGSTGSAGHTNGEIGYSYMVGNCALNNPQTATAPALMVFPVPADQWLNVQCNDGQSQHQVQLWNMLGQEVVRTDNLRLDTSNLPNGIYTLQLDGNPNTTRKINIQHP